MSRSGTQRAETKLGGFSAACRFMNPLIPDPAGLELTADVVNAVEALVAEMDSTAISEAIQRRESTLTPVMEKILQFRPPSHFGINE